jgi:transposase
MAGLGRRRLRSVAARGVAMIRIHALWLCTKPLDMRAGAERLLAHVVHGLGSANAHHGYLFADARATCIKMIVYDGLGVWAPACRPRRAGSWPACRRARTRCASCW